MKRKGYVLPLALFTGLFILTMILVLLDVVIKQIPATEKSIQNAKSEYSVEAGIDEGIYILINQIHDDISKTYNVSYKSTQLNEKTVEIEDIKYKIQFNPNEIKYGLSEKRDSKNRIEYYYINSIINNQFEIISTDLNTGNLIKSTIKVIYNNNKLQWEILDISKDR